MKSSFSRLLIGASLTLVAVVALVVVFTHPNTPATAANVITITAKDMVFDFDTIKVKVGQPVSIRLVNADDMDHQFAVPDLDLYSEEISPHQSSDITFTPAQVGDYSFICAYAHHAQLGMVGTLRVVADNERG